MKQAFLLLAAALTMTMAGHAQTADKPAVPAEGLRMAVIGDSYVKNHREPVENTWHWKLAKKYGMKYYNYGRNGSCVSADMRVWGPSVAHRYESMADSLDIIIVIAGHNDAARLAETVSDTTTTLPHYREECLRLCRGLTERWPQARIFWFTPWANDDPRFDTIVAATKEICGSMGIPVFDAAHESNIFARSDAFRNIYFQGGARDHAHLNARGHDRFLPVAEHFIMQQMF